MPHDMSNTRRCQASSRPRLSLFFNRYASLRYAAVRREAFSGVVPHDPRLCRGRTLVRRADLKVCCYMTEEGGHSMPSPLQSQRQEHGAEDPPLQPQRQRPPRPVSLGCRASRQRRSGPHKSGESPALQSQRRPLQKAAGTWAKEEGTARRSGCPYKGSSENARDGPRLCRRRTAPVPPGCRASRQERSGPPQTEGKPGATKSEAPASESGRYIRQNRHGEINSPLHRRRKRARHSLAYARDKAVPLQSQRHRQRVRVGIRWLWRSLRS
jgi:hypothetical protein